jgi:hypothetical protein
VASLFGMEVFKIVKVEFFGADNPKFDEVEKR